MSHNIDNFEVITGALTMTGSAIRKARKAMDNASGTPEICFLDDLVDKPDPKTVYEVEPAWCSTWSGNSFDELLTLVLPLTRGTADIVYTWEGGGQEGVRVRDGKVTRHEVVVRLGEVVK